MYFLLMLWIVMVYSDASTPLPNAPNGGYAVVVDTPPPPPELIISTEDEWEEEEWEDDVELPDVEERVVDVEETPRSKVWSVDEVDVPPLFSTCRTLDGTSEEQGQCSYSRVAQFIHQHLRYVENSRFIGGLAVVCFEVLEDGRIDHIALVKDPGYGVGEEALRIVRLLQALPERWTPGVNEGEVVPVRWCLPVRFTAR